MKNISSQPIVSSDFLKKLTLAIMWWYVLLCLAHWLGQRPLWLDEFNVFLSVRDFAPQEFFTQKLLGGQIFPKLYLFLVQGVAEPFGLQVLSLRFLSFAAMMSAFYLWMKIMRQEFRDPFSYLLYALSWAGSALLVYYAAELKPYSMDVLVSAIFITFIYRAAELRQKQPRLYLLVLALLPLLSWLSYPAFLFLGFPLYNLLREKDKGGFWKKSLFLYSVSLLMALVSLYLLDLRYAPSTKTQGFDNAISFASVGDFFESWWDGTTNLFCRFWAERPRLLKHIAMPFGILGFGYMFYSFFKNFAQDQYRFISLRTIPLVIYLELFFLGVLKKYPFSVNRTVLFFCPIVLFLVVEFLQTLRQINRYGGMAAQVIYAAFLSTITYGLARDVFSGYLGPVPAIW